MVFLKLKKSWLFCSFVLLFAFFAFAFFAFEKSKLIYFDSGSGSTSDSNSPSPESDAPADSNSGSSSVDPDLDAQAVQIWTKIKTTYLNDLKKYDLKSVGVLSDNTSFNFYNITLEGKNDVPYNKLPSTIQAELKELVGKAWESPLKDVIVSQIWFKFKTYQSALTTYQIDSIMINDEVFSLTGLKTASNLEPAVQTKLEELINKNWEAVLEDAIATQIWFKFRTYLPDIKTFNIDILIYWYNKNYDEYEQVVFIDKNLIKIADPNNTAYEDLNSLAQAELKILIFDQKWDSQYKKEIVPVAIWPKFRTYLLALTAYKITSIEIDGSAFSLSALATVPNPSSIVYNDLSFEAEDQLKALAGKNWEPALKSAFEKKIWNDIKENYGADIAFYEMESLKLKEGVEFPLTEIASQYENLASDSPTKTKLLSLLTVDWKAILEATIMEKIWDDLQWYLPDLKTYKITSITIETENIELLLFVENAFAEDGHLIPEIKAKLQKLINKDWSSALKTVLATAIWNQLKPYLSDLKNYSLENFIADGELFSLTALKTVTNPDSTSYEALESGPQAELQVLINRAWEPALKLIINTKLPAPKIWPEIKKNYFLALKNAQITSLKIGTETLSLANLLALASDAPLPDYPDLGEKSKKELTNLEGKNWEEAIKGALAKKIWDKIKFYLPDLVTYQIDNLLIGDDDFSVLALKKVANPNSITYQKLSGEAQKELQALINKVWEPGLQTILAQPIWNQFKSYLPDLKVYQIAQIIINDAPFPFAPFLQDPNIINLDFFQLTDDDLKQKIKTLIGQNWEESLQTALAAQIWLQFRSPYLSDLKTYQMNGFQVGEDNFAFLELKAVVNPDDNSYEELNKAAQAELKFLIKKEWEALLQTALAQAIWNKFKTYLLALKIYQIDQIALGDSHFSLVAFQKAGSAPLTDYFSLEEGLQNQLKGLIGQDWELALQMVIAPLIWTKFQTNYLAALKTYNIASLTIDSQVFSLIALKAIVNPADVTYLTLNEASQAEIKALVNQDWEPTLEIAIAKQFSEELIWEQIKTVYFINLKNYQISELNLGGATFALTNLLSLESATLPDYPDLNKNAQTELTNLVGKNWKEAIELALIKKFWTKISSTYLVDLQFYDLVSWTIDQKPVQLTVLTQFPSDASYQALSQLAKKELLALIGWDWEAVFQKEIASQIWEEIKSDYLSSLQKYDLPFYDSNYINPTLSYQELEEGLQTALIKNFINKGPTWRKLFQEAIAPQLWNELKEAYLPLLKTTAIVALNTPVANISLVSLKSEEPTTGYPELSDASKKELVELMMIDWEPLLLAKLSTSLSVEAIWARIQTTYLPDLKSYQITQLMVAGKEVNLTAFFALTETAYPDLKPALQAELLQLVGENWEIVFQTALAHQFWSKIQANDYLAELTFYQLEGATLPISFEKIKQLASVSTPYSDLNPLVQSILRKMIGTNWEQNIQLAQNFLTEIYQPIWKQLQTYLGDMKTYKITSLVIEQKTLFFEKLLALSNPSLPYPDLSLETRNQLLPLAQIAWEPTLKAVISTHNKALAIWETVKANYLAALQTHQIASFTLNEEQIALKIISEVEDPNLSYPDLEQPVQTELQKLDGQGWEKELQLVLAWKQLHPYLKQLSARKITEVEELEINSLTSQQAVTNYQTLPQASKTVFQTLIKKPNWEKQVQNLLKPASPPASSSSSSNSSTLTIILFSVGGGIVLLLALFLGYKYFWKKHKRK